MHDILLFARWLKQRRVAQGLTQQQLATQVGCSLSLLRKYEAGLRRPPRATLVRLAAALGLPEAERAAFLAAALPVDTTPPPTTNGGQPGGWLPAAPTRLLGREQEVGQVAARLRTAPGRLITLIGSPGVGKSRLALAVAAAVWPEFADGAWFVGLAELSSATAVDTAIAVRLGLRPIGDVDTLLADYLRPRRLLLLLDNFEHVAEAAPLLGRLLAVAPELSIIVTSRVPLRLRAELCLAVAPLPLARSSDIGSVAIAPASALFCERAVAVQPEFVLDERSAAPVAAICARLDGLPLAIELAAARSDMLAPARLLAEVTQGVDAVSGVLADLPPHQRTLRTTIAWSERLLSPAAQVAFARLGVLVGSFDRAAASALGADQIDELLHAGLVQAVEAERFVLLETLRAYALERLADNGALLTTQARHAAHYAALAEDLAGRLVSANGDRLNGALDRELPNLRAAITWSLAHDGGHLAAQLILPLVPHLFARGYTADARQIEPLLTGDRPHAIPAPLLTHLTLTIAFVASQQGDTVARRLLERGLALARSIDDRASQARALVLMGMVARYPGNFAICSGYLREAIAILETIDAPVRLANAYDQLGAALQQAGRYQEAIQRYQQALRAAALLHSPTLPLSFRLNLAHAVMCTGELRRAQTILTEVLADADALGDTMSRAGSMFHLGQIALLEHDLALAAERFAIAESVFRRHEIAYALVQVVRQQGYLALMQGDMPLATARLNAALQQAITIFHIEEVAGCLSGLALLALAEQPAQAARLLGAAEGLAERFSLAPDALADQYRAQVRARLDRAGREVAGRAAATVRSQITTVSFPDAWTAVATIKLEQVIAAATQV